MARDPGAQHPGDHDHDHSLAHIADGRAEGRVAEGRMADGRAEGHEVPVDHDHDHEHSHGLGHAHSHLPVDLTGDPVARRRAVGIALGANLVTLVAQLVTGLVAGSLALLADSAHLLSDVLGLAVAMAALVLAARPATDRMSYGLQRSEVVGAQINSALLIVSGLGILVAAAQRVGSTVEIDGGPVLVVAVVGLAANVGSALLVSKVAGRSLNLRAAVAHLVVDAVGSVGVIVAGVAVLVADATWVDTAVSVAIGIGVLVTAWSLLRQATHVLLEGVPAHLDTTAVADALRDYEGVVEVHHVHLWSLASDVPALSAHVVLDGSPTLHQAQERGDQLRAVLLERFGVAHATLELECHPCADDDHSVARLTAPVPAAPPGPSGRARPTTHEA